MDNNSRRIGSGFLVAAILLSGLFQVKNVLADANGRTGFTGSLGAANTCTACHTVDPAAAVPTAVLMGPTTTVAAGSTSSFTFTLTGGPAVNAGLDIEASAGMIVDTNAAGTKISAGELVHSAPNTPVGGTITWTFDWVAPMMAGTYTIYAAGLSGSGDDSELAPSDDPAILVADGTAVTSMQITVDAPVNLPPVAMITAPATGMVGTAVTFDGSGSTDADGTIASYAWDFGDTTTGTGVSASHTYTAAGTYTVSLTVTDNNAATNVATTTIVISSPVPNQPPVAMITGPAAGIAGTVVTFDGSGSTDADGTIASYAWDFGDTTTMTGVSATHIYAAAGTFTVTLTVTDNAGDTNMATASIVISAAPPVNQLPIAMISGPTTGTSGVAVAFSGSGSSDPDGTIASYAWDFGDSTTGTGMDVTHTFAVGVFTVALTVTDDAGNTASTTMNIVVTSATVAQPPVADAGGPYTGTVGTAVMFDGSASTDPDGTIASYAWDFGDGMGTATGATPSYMYTAGGTFTVVLTVTDNDGMSGSITTTAMITDPAAPAPTPDMGMELYNTYCASCHGPNGMGIVGVAGGDVVGESTEDIMDAIMEEPTMTFLLNVLRRNEIDKIAMFLDMGHDDDDDDMEISIALASPGETLYGTFCASCHSSTNASGLTTSDVINASAQDIKAAVAREQTMANQVGTLSDDFITQIVQFLDRPTGVQVDTTGQTNANEGDSGGGGSLLWLSLLFPGIWFIRRRRFS